MGCFVRQPVRIHVIPCLRVPALEDDRQPLPVAVIVSDRIGGPLTKLDAHTYTVPAYSTESIPPDPEDGSANPCQDAHDQADDADDHA